MEEKFGLSLQMRRASASIRANIAEGFGKWSPKDQARSYEIAKGSTEEVRHFLILSERLGFLKADPALSRLKKWVFPSGGGGTVCLGPWYLVLISSGCTG